MAGGGDQFAKFAGPVAIEILGEPNKKLSSKDELRFGNKGSLSVDLKKGTFFEHGADEGGGVLWFIEKQTGRKGREAVEWLREHGFSVEDRASDSNRHYGPDNTDSPRSRDDGPPFRAVATWDYVDETGGLLFQVVRMENGLIGKDGKPEKTYRQRRPDASKAGGWDWSTKGVRQVPYRLPDLLEALQQGLPIFIVEGEKAADRLIDLGVPATTNARGAGKWAPELNEFFRGARAVVLADDDPQAATKDGQLRFHEDGRPIFVGLDHARFVASALSGIAEDVRMVQLTDRKMKEDVVDWLNQGGTIEDLYRIAKAAPRFEREPYRSRFHAVTWADMDKPGPEHEWLIKGILTRAEVGMCAGPSKSGKSFLVIDAALAIARGTSWFGRRVVKGGVIYQAGEGQKGLKKRIRAYREDNGISPADPLDFVLLPARIDLYHSDDHTDALIEECRHWAGTFRAPLELIVIDTWATATPGANENDGKDVSVVLQRAAKLSQATGAAVLIVHHMNADGSKVRGHTSILGNLENVLIVRQCEGLRDDAGRQIREAVVDKNKDGEDGARFRFTLRSVQIGADEDGDPITSCVVANVEGEGSDQPAPERPGVSNNEANIVRAIERAELFSSHEHPSGRGIPAGARIVLWRDVISEFDKIEFDDVPDDETPEQRDKRLDARLKRLKRSGENLLRKNIIGRDNPYVWLTGRRIKGYRSEYRQTAPQPEPRKSNTEENHHDGSDFVEPSDELWGN
ncbi:AAA domain-containing protein [Rhizobium subbaraonis]|uniref:AAA domain-containing protein n=1 Tax=Rhizobium subbaraonis TaxID=908946 RepID=A0A285U5E9_9HYPH|nr:AAA family ATPase [Rhizobium subbaraonis]SOC37062.1 AAA domain-containing protein [Rhizobium subbaraonis]